MGCKGSKLEEQEAVALCRGRADLLAAAVRHRYALADAHAALADSLAALSDSLHLLMAASASPRLTLPSTRKTVNPPTSPPHPSSHLHFASSSGSDSASPCSSPLHHVPDQLQHPHPHPHQHPHQHFVYGYMPEPALSSLQFDYARSHPPPASVAVEQHAAPSERVYFGSLGAAGGYPQYYSYGDEPVAAAAAQRPLPPPSPPRSSSWDFFNVFDNYQDYDNYYYDDATAVAYTPSRSSREVREEEGIPELEDDGEDSAVIKEVASEYSTAGSGGGRSRRSSVGGVSSIAELDEAETIVVDKEVVGSSSEVRRRTSARRNVAAPGLAPPARRVVDSVDIASEIKAQFLQAAEAVRALAPMLEVGRPRYPQRNSVYHVSSRMVSAVGVPHLRYRGEEFLDIGGQEKMLGGRSLSLTLQKLYIWERKLYDEVKAEEKMRLLLAKNSKRLKFMDQKGAEAHKIDATRNLVRKLSTKMKIAMQVIAKISKKINKVRDEELGPQINALIQGFVNMWQDKLDCYQIQCQVISEVKSLDSIVSGGNDRDLAMELELELIKWIINFSSWVSAQRNFVKALNGWLALCLNYKPEETVPPYSPGRVGAPLVFVICNSWSQAMDRISEKDMAYAMQALVSSVWHLWEQQNLEQSEQILAIREREKWIKTLERKALEINKEADALNRKLALVPGQQTVPLLQTVQTYEAHFLEASNLQASLRLALQALENFATNSLQAFQEIVRHTEEERLCRENAKVP